MSRQEKLFLLIVALICMALIAAVFFANQKTYYSDAYTPMVENSRHNHDIMEQNRKNRPKVYESEPSAAGFKESEIDKNKGSRFSTY